jgi:hypothetical protein
MVQNNKVNGCLDPKIPERRGSLGEDSVETFGERLVVHLAHPLAEALVALDQVERVAQRDGGSDWSTGSFL